MLVLCDECHNHYDDSFQSPECRGIGSSVAGFSSSSHIMVQTKPVEEHIDNVRRAWAAPWSVRPKKAARSD